MGRRFGLISCLLGGMAVSQMACQKEHRNRLGKEKSPYLLQHKDNPVWWYAWNEEAFSAAKKENKPIFLSVGYSTCHWCHVMERESFEDQQVADVLNKDFISIKVDREERPDVDKIYMDAVMATRGQGGWPMSVFLTPDLKPFFGGTYFPKTQFLALLNQIQKGWQDQRDQIEQTGEALTQHLKAAEIKGKGLDKVSEAMLIAAFHIKKSTFDEQYGGFGHQPKFPPSTALMLLLRIAKRTGNQKALEMVTRTLDRMAQGGIYDHVGGGFARYSTDEAWLVPHFEKMLYDNALLSMIYLEAYQATQKPMYLEIAKETLDYVVRDMMRGEGGFYSAEDADSEGQEGKFYVWSHEELKQWLTEAEFKKFIAVYGVTSAGNFEHKANILHLSQDADWQTKKDPLIQTAHQKLFKAREKRVHPHKDDKILTAWNGLMIASMAKGYQLSGDQKYFEAAQSSAAFIQKHLFQNNRLLRRYRDGEAKFSANLDDYAFYVQGLLMLYEADFNPQWLTWARETQKIQDELLWDEQGGYFFTSSDDPTLIRRSKDYHDGAKPNSNGVSALNLLKLHDYTFEASYLEKAKKTLFSAASELAQYPEGFGQMQIALDYYLDRSKEIAVIGHPEDPQTKKILAYLRETFLPNKVIAFSTPQEARQIPLTDKKTMQKGKTTVYVCENNICQWPTHDLEVVQKQVSEFKKYALK